MEEVVWVVEEWWEEQEWWRDCRSLSDGGNVGGAGVLCVGRGVVWEVLECWRDCRRRRSGGGSVGGTGVVE